MHSHPIEIQAMSSYTVPRRPGWPDCFRATLVAGLALGLACTCPAVMAAGIPDPTTQASSPSGGVKHLFAKPRLYSVEGFPHSVGIADLNGDGRPDLAVAGSGPDASILLAKGGGTFGRSNSELATPFGAYSLAVGDLNADGKPDLAIYSPSNDRRNVAIFLGNGDGTFAAGPQYDTFGRNFVGSVAIGDLNGDRKLDLVAGGAGHSVYVLLGNGDGTFQSGTGFETGQVPSAVAIGDLNADGRQDLAVAHGGIVDSVSVLLGLGDGTFAPYRSYQTGSGGVAMVEADVNGDGRPDLVTANLNANSVSVLLGAGDGTFAPRIDHVTGQYPECIAAGDLNDDGKVDVVVGVADVMGTNVLLGNGDGTFGPSVDYDPGFGGVAIGDLNGDGRPDVAVGTTNGGQGAVAVLRNRSHEIMLPLSAAEIAYRHGTGTLSFRVSPNAGIAARDFHFVTVDQADVRLVLYDVSGRLVSEIYRGAMDAGTHLVHWDGRTSSGSIATRGLYFARLLTPMESSTIRVLLLSRN